MMKQFQSDRQLSMLKVHAILMSVAHWAWTPIRWVQEQINGTDMVLHWDDKPKAK